MEDIRPVLCVFQGGGTSALESHVGELMALEEYVNRAGCLPGDELPVEAPCEVAVRKFSTYDYRYSGTSAGAITAALLAENWAVDDIKNLLMNTPIEKWFRRVRWRTWLTPLGYADYIFDNSGVKKFLYDTVGINALRSTEVAVTRMKDYASLMMHATPEAVLASTSIPFIFKPVVIDNVEYGDGGVLNNIPMPTFTKAGDYRHIFVFLNTQTMVGVRNSTIGRLLDLLSKVMEREAHQILEYGWGDLKHVTIFNPPPYKETNTLQWSDHFGLMKHAYTYACGMLTAKYNRKDQPSVIEQLNGCADSSRHLHHMACFTYPKDLDQPTIS